MSISVQTHSNGVAYLQNSVLWDASSGPAMSTVPRARSAKPSQLSTPSQAFEVAPMGGV